MWPLEILKYSLELVVLSLVYREIRALRRHEGALERHEKQLKHSQPLFSTLSTDRDEIMRLAIQFTKDAERISALGTISSLLNTEMQPGESDSDFKERLKKTPSLDIDYITANRDFILSGKNFRRIIDWMPAPQSDRSLLEMLANAKFFIRALEYGGTTEIKIELYHNPDILRGRGDFHFRCSDRCVVFRAGGHGNSSANVAISITDTRVVSEFHRYFDSLLSDANTRPISLTTLRQIRDLLENRDLTGLNQLLKNLPKV